MARFAVMVLFVVAACESSSGGSGTTGSGSGSAVAQAPVKNPGGGFSADLAKKLDTAGSGNDTAPRTPGSMSGESSAGGSNSGDMKSGTTAETKMPDTKASDSKAPNTKVADAKTPDTKTADTKTPDTKASDMKTPDTKTPDTKSSTPATPDTKSSTPATPDTKVATGKPETKTPDVSTAPKINGAPVMGSTPKGPVTVPAELKAVNINLLPNWDRDVEGAGTISFVVKIPGKQETATFVFQYNVEDSKAPADRDAYKKWLADNKIFTSKDDRQKGAAWYLEGVNGQGRPAFRMVVLYGGKRLICGGSLYKESPLGDTRDQVIIQAKQICESVTL